MMKKTGRPRALIMIVNLAFPSRANIDLSNAWLAMPINNLSLQPRNVTRAIRKMMCTKGKKARPVKNAIMNKPGKRLPLTMA
jgi:hypothetical protein